MKTNITSLMNLISEEEKQINMISFKIKNCVYNVEIQELNGTINVIEENEKEFKEMLEELELTTSNLNKHKSILFERNNTLKLKDGRTIQTAINDNTNNRRLKSVYESLLNYRSKKTRVTEVNNSYFESKKVNFDMDEVKDRIQDLQSIIDKTDFEISKLNSIEFTI